MQIKTGPFDVGLIFAPDGIESVAAAKERGLKVQDFRIANLRDIIRRKKASKRQKDILDLPLLEAFLDEYEKQRVSPLLTAAEIAEERSRRRARVCRGLLCG